MPKLRVHSFAISLDGYGAGLEQTLENPMGAGARALHEWVFETQVGREMIGQSGGTTGVNNTFMQRGFDGIGATIMGRNMFGPIRGEWGDTDWRGWWEENPPFHHPVFVLTHHAHEPMEMEGGTTFYFVTDGIESALEQAREAAGDQDIRLGGGVSTVQAYLHAGHVDDLHVAIVPALLGAGERLFDGFPDGLPGLEPAEVVADAGVVHVRLVRS
jgi:dihydrofolate reductase